MLCSNLHAIYTWTVGQTYLGETVGGQVAQLGGITVGRKRGRWLLQQQRSNGREEAREMAPITTAE